MSEVPTLIVAAGMILTATLAWFCTWIHFKNKEFRKEWHELWKEHNQVMAEAHRIKLQHGIRPRYSPPSFTGFKQHLIDNAKPGTKETNMRALDLSPSMIGKTVRIERDNIVGTHNYIEGTLEDFNFETTSANACGYSAAVNAYPTDLTATIAGYEINLKGTEKLTTTDD